MVCWLFAELKWIVRLCETGPVGDVPSLGVFLSNPSPYLREFGRKPWKTPNGLVNKRDRGLILAPPVHKLWAQNRSTTGRALFYGAETWTIAKANLKKKVISSRNIFLETVSNKFKIGKVCTHYSSKSVKSDNKWYK